MLRPGMALFLVIYHFVLLPLTTSNMFWPCVWCTDTAAMAARPSTVRPAATRQDPVVIAVVLFCDTGKTGSIDVCN